MKNMREILDMSTQISKDPKWKDKKSNDLYHIPTFIYIIFTAIFTYIIFSGSIETKSPVTLGIINIVGFLSLALSVRYLFYGMVYAKTEEVSLGEYILRSVPGLILLVILPFVSDILLSVYTLLGKFMEL